MTGGGKGGGELLGLALPFGGIDLTAGSRPSNVAALDVAGQTVSFESALTDADIQGALRRLGARVVAIDSPMGLPAGMCCLEESCPCHPEQSGTGRSAERALAERGIPCFWTTKRTIIKSMVYRAIALKKQLEEEGYTILEVYPYAVKRILLGRQIPRKTRPQGIGFLVQAARSQLPACRWPAPWRPTHDELDALFCAITARLYELGATESLGDPDEVPIVVPKPDPRTGQLDLTMLRKREFQEF